MTLKLINITFLIVLVFISGCMYALQPGNSPYNVKLRLDTCQPEYYKLLVASGEFEVYDIDVDGRVDFTIPPLGKGCKVLIFGIIPVADHGPFVQKATYIFRGPQIIKNISINDIKMLPVDEAGYRILKIE